MKYPEIESATIELKQIVPENDQIVKTIIGFCNGNGGRLIIGVANDGTIFGLPELEIQKIMEYLHKSIFEASCPPIIPLIYSQRIADVLLLIIQVSSGMNKPYYRKSEGLDKGTYMRLGRSTLRATADMIEELKWQSRGKSYDSMPVHHAKEEDLNPIKMLDFFNRRKVATIPKLSQDLLLSYNLITQEHSKIYATAGGVLLFGNEPQKYFAESFIVCTHFAGTSGREVIATIDAIGTLFEQFDTAFNFIVGRLNSSFTIKGPKRDEQLEIPSTAIREVLLNAIVHRNYHIQGPIKVAVYDNRIEVFSPGVFPGPLNTNNLRMGITYIRNTVICKVFREAGYIEKMGSGFIELFESYEKRGLYAPQVIEGENFIKCILPRLAFAVKQHENSLEQKMLAFFEVTDDVGIADIMRVFNLTRATAGRRLAELAKKKFIKSVSQGRATRYRKFIK